MIKFKHKEVQEVINTIHVDNLQEYEEEFTTEDGLTLLKQAVSSFYVCKALQEMSKTADFSGTNIFFTTFMATVERLCDMHVNTNNLDSLLESWNLRREVVPGDESCLFTSVANSLIQRVQCGDMLVSDIFARFGVPDEHFTDVEYIRQVLRVKMVEEWNVNTEYYQGFLTVDLTSVSQDFLDNTQFSGSAGDLMA